MLFPLRRIWSSLVTRRPSLVVSNSVTSSSTMFTKSSKPMSVPTTSLSFFMMMCIRDPIAGGQSYRVADAHHHEERQGGGRHAHGLRRLREHGAGGRDGVRDDERGAA